MRKTDEVNYTDMTQLTWQTRFFSLTQFTLCKDDRRWASQTQPSSCRHDISSLSQTQQSSWHGISIIPPLPPWATLVPKTLSFYKSSSKFPVFRAVAPPPPPYFFWLCPHLRLRPPFWAVSAPKSKTTLFWLCPQLNLPPPPPVFLFYFNRRDPAHDLDQYTVPKWRCDCLKYVWITRRWTTCTRDNNGIRPVGAERDQDTLSL